MDNDERVWIQRSPRLLGEHENAPRIFVNPYSGMIPGEKSKLIIYQQELIEREKARADRVDAKLDKANDGISKMVELML